jgi:TM2 domain-containing membrane protein YozV
MKNKLTATVLTLFLGGIGIHKFYLGKSVQGILYMLFCWTFIPSILAFFEFFGLLFMSDNSFNMKYNNGF